VGLIHRGRLLVEGEPQSLLAAFEHDAFEVEGGDRAAVEAALAARPEVMASSPAGAHLKVVLSRGGAERVGAALARAGARLAPAVPDFEDLFLARIAASEAEAEGSP
jgi:ABC-2 type transport system ATP-binding protein